MINVKYVYHRNKKMAKLNPNQLSIELLHAEAAKLFRFGKKPLMLFYIDEYNHRILLLNDEHVHFFYRLATDRPDLAHVYLDLREHIISAIRDENVLEIVLGKLLLSAQLKLGKFSNKKLITDLQCLKDSLEKSILKNAQVKSLLCIIRKKVRDYFIDEEFEETISSVDDTIKVDNACSSILEKKTESSFFSRPDEWTVTEADTTMKETKRMFRKKNNNGLVCKSCRSDLNKCIRFQCEMCCNFVFCENCVESAVHIHPLNPVFSMNDNLQKFTALHKVFKKLSLSRKEYFFKVFSAEYLKG